MKKITLLTLIITMPFLLADKYPLESCIISGEKLGSMGEPYIFKYEGVEVHLCCSKCKPKFEKNPEKYLSIITNASKAKN